MHHYGIIGKPLAQSFSARYFGEKFAREGIDAEYSMYPIEDIEEVRPLLERLDGMNVTIPYKQAIIPYLDELDETAEQVGAVNVIAPIPPQSGTPLDSECYPKHSSVPKGARERYMKGYNTDCVGFVNSIRKYLRPGDKRALVLGTGGASKAVVYGLRKLGIEAQPLSRREAAPFDQGGQEKNGYEYLKEHPEVLQDYQVIVNATPVGMYPEVNAAPELPYEMIGPEHLLFDCIYNPEETVFLRKGRERGARTVNGIEMLIGQAEAAWGIWNKDEGRRKKEESITR